MNPAVARQGRRLGPGPSANPPNCRDDILHAAAEVFSDVGVEAATVRKIAAAAGVSTGAVYLYFDGKEGLVLAVCAPKARDLKLRVEALRTAAVNPVSRVLAILEASLEWALRNLDVYDLFFGRSVTHRLEKVWAEGRELEGFCLRALEVELGSLLAPAHDGSRGAEVAQALWASANGVLGLCLRTGCAKPVGGLLATAVEPILRELIATSDGPAVATPRSGAAVH